MLVAVEVEGLALEAAMGGEEVAAAGTGRENATVVLGVELGEKADSNVGAEFGAVAAEILPEEDPLEGGAGDAAGLGFDVGAEFEEGRAGALVRHADEDDGTGAGGASGDDLGGVGDGLGVVGVLRVVGDGA